MSREINTPSAHIPLFSVSGCTAHFAENQNSGMRSLEDGSATTNTMARSNRIFTLVCLSAEQSYVDKAEHGGVGGWGRKAAQQRAPTPTSSHRQGCTVADRMKLSFIFFFFFFPRRVKSAKVWRGVSGGLIRAVSETTVAKKGNAAILLFIFPLPHSSWPRKRT